MATITSPTTAENTGPLTFTGTGYLANTNYFVTTVEGTATAADFTAQTDVQVTSDAGGNLTFNVTLNNDAINEGDETFTVNVRSAAAGGGTLEATGTGTITNDDAAPVFSIAAVSQNEGSAGANTYTFTVTKTGTTELATSVQYSTSDGTATVADGDYTATGLQTLNFAAGEASKTFTVTVAGDTKFEGNEAFNVTLSNPTGATIGAGQGTATGTLVNDDALPTFAISAATVAEGDAGTATLTYTVTKTGTTDSTSSVAFATADGTATVADGDYVAQNNTLTFGAGETSKTVSVVVNGDTRVEGAETVLVNLSGAAGATIATAQGTGTITNDDTSGTVSINSIAILEGGTGTNPTATLTLTRTGGTAPFTVNYSTANGTATAGSDYVAVVNGTATFAAGINSVQVPITINGDFNPEANETFTVTLSNPSNSATIGTATGTVTITDDDTAGGGGGGGGTPTPTQPASDPNPPVQSGSSTFVSASYTQPAGDTQTTISTRNNAGTEAINITGNANTQTIIGNYGVNVLTGGGGADTLIGLFGNDTYVISTSNTVVVENASEGTDTVQTSVDYVLSTESSIEVLAVSDASGTAAVNLTGSTAAQQITGNAGANIINGFGGGDTMTGLAGNDQYLVRGAGDQVIEGNGGGIDTVFTTISYSLGVNEVEVLSTVTNGETTNIDLTGNFATQTIVGNYGTNVLNGGSGGLDTLIGLRGNDVYAVGDSRTVIVENGGEGSDTVVVAVDYTLAAGVSVEVLAAQDRSGTTALALRGNEVAQTIVGNNGANILDGGLGSDQLAGGGGADSFRFTTALGANNVDSIADFEAGLDKIGLTSAIFGVTAVNTANFHSGAAATSADHRIVFNQATGQLFYDADGNGAGAATLFALLTPGTVLTSSSFEIVVAAIA